MEKLDVTKLRVNGKSFTGWNQVIAEFKNMKSGSSNVQPLDISYNGRQFDEKKPSLINIEKKQTLSSSSLQAAHENGQKPIKIGGGFTFLKIILALAAVGIIIYYIYKFAS